MSLENFTYPLDLTGTSSLNRIESEEHVLKDSPVRSLVPKQGAFYTESMVVIDDVTGLALTPKRDFICVEVSEQITARTNKEACYIVIIRTPDVSSTVSITYQLVGGHYVNVAAVAGRIYESMDENDSGIDWNTEVFNKPEKFIPSLHPHSLKDIDGVGSIVESLERLRSAILLSNVPAFERLVQWVNLKLSTLNVATCADIDSGLPTNQLIDVRGVHRLIANSINMKSLNIQDIRLGKILGTKRVVTGKVSYNGFMDSSTLIVEAAYNTRGSKSSRTSTKVVTGNGNFSFSMPLVGYDPETIITLTVRTEEGYTVNNCDYVLQAGILPSYIVKDSPWNDLIYPCCNDCC